MDPSVDHIMTGINNISLHLSQPCSQSTQGILLVCKQDVHSSNLFSHFPTLTALSNPQHLLVALGKGSQSVLNKTIGKNSESTCAFIYGSSHAFTSLYKDIFTITGPLDLPWVRDASQYIPTSIKILKTSAPILQKKNKRH